jgi:hypothetical protein
VGVIKEENGRATVPPLPETEWNEEEEEEKKE